MILIDTSAWSRLLRRRPDVLTEAVATRFNAARLAGLTPTIPGIALQELLSGVHCDERFARLLGRMQRIPIALALEGDHRMAAELANACGRHGIATTLPDCLIAAQAVRLGVPVLTCDKDFERMAPHASGLGLFP